MKTLVEGVNVIKDGKLAPLARVAVYVRGVPQAGVLTKSWTVKDKALSPKA